MKRKEIYTAWKNRRKDVEVDAGFADRVMQRVLAPQGQPSGDAPSPRRANHILDRRTWDIPTMAALLLVSLTVGLLRYGSVIALLILMGSTGY